MKIHEYNEMMSYLTRPSYVSGGRVGFAQGTPLYTATAENFKLLDNLILNTKKTLNVMLT